MDRDTTSPSTGSRPAARARYARPRGIGARARCSARSNCRLDVDGKGLRPGSGSTKRSANMHGPASGTLLGPMLAQIRSAAGARRAGQLARRGCDPAQDRRGAEPGRCRRASCAESSGDTLAGACRASSLRTSLPGAPRFSGNFSTGGSGLPRIAGRMEQRRRSACVPADADGANTGPGGGSLELPELMVAQGPGGTLGFSGTARASGAIPGGDARGWWCRSAATGVPPPGSRCGGAAPRSTSTG